MKHLIERIETLAHPENITESRMGKKAHDGYAEAKNLLVSVLRSAPTLFKKHKNVEAASVSGNAVTVQLVSHEPVVITYQLKAYARAKSGAALHMKSGASKIAFDFPSQAVASWTLPDMVASLFTDFAKKHAVRIPLPKNVAPRPKLRAPKPAPKPAAPALTPGEVTSFLKRLTTRTGGRNRDVYFNDDPKWPSWSAEPQHRQSLDHFGNDGDGWDEDGWDDEYAGPLQKEVQRAIDQKFGKGVLGIAVGEKGHIDVQPTAKGKRLIERLEENAMKELIERIESLTEDKYDPRRIFGGSGSMRLFSAFQVLGGLPVRGVSKSDALKVVGKMTGLKMPSSLRVPSEGKAWRLEDWLDWLAEWAEASGQMEWAEPYAWAVTAAKRKGFYPDE